MWWSYYRQLERWILQLDTKDWVWVFVVGMVVGLLCMRGLSSRLH